MEILHPDDKAQKEKWKKRCDSLEFVCPLLALSGLLTLAAVFLASLFDREAAVSMPGVVVGVIALGIGGLLMLGTGIVDSLKARQWRYLTVNDELVRQWSRLTDRYAPGTDLTTAQFEELSALQAVWQELTTSRRVTDEAYHKGFDEITARIVASLRAPAANDASGTVASSS